MLRDSCAFIVSNYHFPPLPVPSVRLLPLIHRILSFTESSKCLSCSSLAHRESSYVFFSSQHCVPQAQGNRTVRMSHLLPWGHSPCTWSHLNPGDAGTSRGDYCPPPLQIAGQQHADVGVSGGARAAATPRQRGATGPWPLRVIG